MYIPPSYTYLHIPLRPRTNGADLICLFYVHFPLYLLVYTYPSSRRLSFFFSFPPTRKASKQNPSFSFAFSFSSFCLSQKATQERKRNLVHIGRVVCSFVYPYISALIYFILILSHVHIWKKQSCVFSLSIESHGREEKRSFYLSCFTLFWGCGGVFSVRHAGKRSFCIYYCMRT